MAAWVAVLGAELLALLERAGFNPHQPRDPLGKWTKLGAILRKALMAAADAGDTDAVALAYAAEHQRITGRPVRVSFRGSDPYIAAQHAEGLLRMQERYPEVRIQQVAVYGDSAPGRTDLWSEDVEGAYAWAGSGTASPAPAAPWLLTVAFNLDFSEDPDRYARWIEADQKRGWNVTPDPVSIAIHEFGHRLAADTGAKEDVKALVRERAKAAGKKPAKYVQDEISEYASTDYDELMAEAFADVQLHGDQASALSRAIVDIIDGRYRRRHP